MDRTDKTMHSKKTKKLPERDQEDKKSKLFQRKRQDRSSRKAQSTGFSKNRHHRAGRWLKEPKPEHEIVLRALEIANLAFRRVVNVDEAIKALTAKEFEILQSTYTNPLSATVSKIIGLLHARGLVFTPGKFGQRGYYGVASVLDPKTASLPSEPSRRQRVLHLVRLTVKKLGRAVRTGDILDNAAELLDVPGITPTDIMHDVLNLKKTGDLRVVGSVRGDGKGINLYLPAELDLNDYTNSEPLTRLEVVVQTFNELWAERMNQTAASGRKPRPLSTGEIRQRLSEVSSYPEILADPLTLVNAMQQLAKSENAKIRKVRRPKMRSVLWAPKDVEDADLDINDTYASDAERICEAVRRATCSLGRPVNLNDIQDQVESDPTLQPAGSSGLFSILSDIAKETVDAGDGTRRKRATQHVYRIGKIGEVSYYFTEKTPEAEAFVEVGGLEARWTAMRIDEEVNSLETCSLPSVAIGRAMLVETETNAFLHNLNRLCSSKHLDTALQQKAYEIRERAVADRNTAHKWLDHYGSKSPRIPKRVNTHVPGWTLDELLKVVRPLYPRSQKIEKASKLAPLIGDVIRRVQNPEFVNRFSDDPRKASEYLYDRTDALIYIAKEWGGYECCLQATLAGNELGLLRDPRFVFPALEIPDFNARLAAIACLAFLPSEAGNEHLRRIAINDSDPGVRQSALWAYGFAGGKDAHDLLNARSENDVDVRIRIFSREIIEASKESWWLL
jgi:hypothetical protein